MSIYRYLMILECKTRGRQLLLAICGRQLHLTKGPSSVAKGYKTYVCTVGPKRLLSEAVYHVSYAQDSSNTYTSVLYCGLVCCT